MALAASLLTIWSTATSQETRVVTIATVFADVDTEALSATRLMADVINRSGFSVDGQPVRLAIEQLDSGGDPVGVFEMALKHLEGQQAKYLIVPEGAAARAAVVGALNEADTQDALLLATDPVGVEAADLLGSMLFTLLSTWPDRAEGLADGIAASLGERPAALSWTFVSSDPAPSPAADALLTFLRAIGAEATRNVSPEPSVFDAPVDALILEDAASLGAVTRIAARHILILDGCPSFENVSLPNLVEAACLSDWSPDTLWEGPLPSQNSRYSVEDFAEQMRETVGRVPSPVSAASGAAVLVLAHAMERASATDPDSVRAQLNGFRLPSFFGQIELVAGINRGHTTVFNRPAGVSSDGPNRCGADELCRTYCARDPDCTTEKAAN